MCCTPLAYDYLWRGFGRSQPVGVWLLSIVGLLGCFQNAQLRDHDDVSVLSSRRPIDADVDIAKSIGQEALSKIGYDELLKLADQAGFVEKKVELKVQLVSYESAVTTGFSPVFSRYALAAGVTSQADSPLPGPADLAALGILVIGLVDAGLLDGHLFTHMQNFVASSASTLAAAATTIVRDYGQNCRDQLKNCMARSPSRGLPHSGSTWNKSICVDCYDTCIAQRGVWPIRTFDDKDCQWWDGR